MASHACVVACPHNVLEIVGGVATPVALDQCMEDMSCMAECPTVPKACVVVNTGKAIPPRKVPRRDQKLMTEVPGIYLIGDVSGLPLIKNAINEGARVIDYIDEDLRDEGPTRDIPYDVAIIGVGPAGLSATAIAKQRGLRYVAIEQNKIVSTIQNYPVGKYVIFKPDTVVTNGALPLPGIGAQAAVQLTGFRREGAAVAFTSHNEVTLVVRSDFKGDLKLANKINVYDCMDAGRIKVFFRTTIKEIGARSRRSFWRV